MLIFHLGKQHLSNSKPRFLTNTSFDYYLDNLNSIPGGHNIDSSILELSNHLSKAIYLYFTAQNREFTSTTIQFLSKQFDESQARIQESLGELEHCALIEIKGNKLLKVRLL